MIIPTLGNFGALENCFENGCSIKCGRAQQVWLCAHLLLVLGIAHLYTKVGFQNCCFSACSLYRKTKRKGEKTKRKEKKTKKRNKKEFGFEHCVRTEVGSVGVWDYFHA